jgi:MFS family permease
MPWGSLPAAGRSWPHGTCGLLVGAGAILIFTFGVFLKPVTEDLISRGELSSGLGISAWFVALSCPIIGWLIDRFGTRKPWSRAFFCSRLRLPALALCNPSARSRQIRFLRSSTHRSRQQIEATRL